jgi:potassium efflux system protein
MTKPHLLHHFIWNSLMLARCWRCWAPCSATSTPPHLLRQLELSLLAGLGCLLVYYPAHRWMLIQRRRLAFDRAKQKRAEILAQRAEEDDLSSEIPMWWRSPSWIWIPSAPSPSAWCAPC